MKNILILGALGHIGSKLIRAFSQYQEDVNLTLIDSFKTSKYNSLFDLPEGPNYNFIEGDVRDSIPEELNNKIDCVVHLAALTNPTQSAKDPAQFMQYNESCTKSVLDFCIQNESDLIFISSTSVYDRSHPCLNEETKISIEDTQSPYASCKLKEEALIKNAIEETNLNAKILRFGTIYGVSPGMRFHTAVNKFCWDAAIRGSITVWETALEQNRPYLDLQDAVRAIKHFIFNKADSGIYNCATNTNNVNEIVGLISEFKANVTINKIESSIMNRLTYGVDNGKLIRTGFEFEGNLRIAIKETLSLFKDLNV